MRGFFFPDDTIGEVFVVPNFISEGYFTQTVIPRELELAGPSTTRPNGQTWIYHRQIPDHFLAVDGIFLHRQKGKVVTRLR